MENMENSSSGIRLVYLVSISSRQSNNHKSRLPEQISIIQKCRVGSTHAYPQAGVPHVSLIGSLGGCQQATNPSRLGFAMLASLQ